MPHLNSHHLDRRASKIEALFEGLDDDLLLRPAELATWFDCHKNLLDRWRVADPIQAAQRARDTLTETNEVFRIGSRVADRFGEGLIRVLQNGEDAWEAFKNVALAALTDIATEILRGSFDKALRKLAAGPDAGGAGGGSGFAGFLASLFGGGGAAFAAGGAGGVGNIATGGGDFIIGGVQHGADFKVGGSGGTDSQLVQFMASPDERVSVRTPSQQESRGGGSGGGDTNFFMDFRGSNGSEELERTVRKAIIEAAPVIREAAVSTTLDRMRRNPRIVGGSGSR